MCCLQPINMADKVSWTEDEGCTLHIVTVSREHAYKSTAMRQWHLNTQIIEKRLTPSPICFDSPVIQKIRQDCSKEFVEFEHCLRENQGTPTSCSTHVARFLGCAETVDLSGVGKSLLERATTQSHMQTVESEGD